MQRAASSFSRSFVRLGSFRDVSFVQGQRLFQSSAIVYHGASDKNKDKPIVRFSFVDKENNEYPVEGHVGDHLLEIAHSHNVDLEGACEASLACSTCHVILPNEIFDQLEEPEEEENDMLDLAFGLTET